MDFKLLGTKSNGFNYTIINLAVACYMSGSQLGRKIAIAIITRLFWMIDNTAYNWAEYRQTSSIKLRPVE